MLTRSLATIALLALAATAAEAAETRVIYPPYTYQPAPQDIFIYAYGSGAGEAGEGGVQFVTVDLGRRGHRGGHAKVTVPVTPSSVTIISGY